MNRQEEMAALEADRISRMGQPGRYGAPPRPLAVTPEMRQQDAARAMERYAEDPTPEGWAAIQRWAAGERRMERIMADR